MMNQLYNNLFNVVCPSFLLVLITLYSTKLSDLWLSPACLSYCCCQAFPFSHIPFRHFTVIQWPFVIEILCLKQCFELRQTERKSSFTLWTSKCCFLVWNENCHMQICTCLLCMPGGWASTGWGISLKLLVSKWHKNGGESAAKNPPILSC